MENWELTAAQEPTKYTEEPWKTGNQKHILLWKGAQLSESSPVEKNWTNTISNCKGK